MPPGVELREGLAQTGRWSDELLALAERAEHVANREPDLQAICDLSQEAHRYLFLAMDPKWIARCCRLSARLLVPVLANPESLDRQADSIWRLRERVRSQAHEVTVQPGEGPELPPDPDVDEEQGELLGLDDEPPAQPVAVSPQIQQLRPRAERMRMQTIPLTEEELQEQEAREAARRERIAARLPVGTTAAPRRTTPAAPRRAGDEVRNEPPAHLAGWLSPPAAAEKLGVSRSAITAWIRSGKIPAEQVACVNGYHHWLHPDVQKPAPAVKVAPEVPDGWEHPDAVAKRLGVSRSTIKNMVADGRIPADRVLRSGWRWWIDSTFEPPPKPDPTRDRTPLPPIPDGWLSAQDAAELLEVHPGTMTRWRDAGRFGEQGEGWARRGERQYVYSVAAVEQVLAEAEQGLDQLLQEITAA